jgi:hypothetical protein
MPLFAGRRMQDVQTADGLREITYTFTRPADTTAYAAGDLVANNTTAGSVVPLAFASAVREEGACLRIERVRLIASNTSLTNASFRVYIFRVSPTVSVGDNGALNASSVLALSDVKDLIGWADITLDRSGTASAVGRGVPSTGSGMTASPTTGTTLYGLIEATAAYTPTSGETFTVALEGQWS